MPRCQPSSLVLILITAVFCCSPVIGKETVMQSSAQDAVTANTATTTASVDITVAGHVKVVWTEGIKVTLSAAQGLSYSTLLSETGHYQFGGNDHPLTPGVWQLRVTDTVTGLTKTQKILVANAPVEVASITLYESPDE